MPSIASATLATISVSEPRLLDSPISPVIWYYECRLGDTSIRIYDIGDHLSPLTGTHRLTEQQAAAIAAVRLCQLRAAWLPPRDGVLSFAVLRAGAARLAALGYRLAVTQ